MSQPRRLSIFFLMCIALCMTVPLHGQSQERMDKLVFEPVLMEKAPVITPVLSIGDMSGVGNLTSLALITPPDTSAYPDITPGSSAEVEEVIDNYRQGISVIENSEGPFAPSLTQELLSLGILYQDLGDHLQALESLKRADHISRVNNGLYHVDQFPIVERMIESYFALGEYAAANDNQRYLVFLNDKLSDTQSSATIPMLSRLGDSNMEKFDQTIVRGEVDEPIVHFEQMLPLSGVPDIEDPARRYAIRNLIQAKNTYFEAISSVLDNADYDNPRLLDLEYKFLETVFLLGYTVDMLREPHYYLTRARYESNTANRWKFLRRNEAGYLTGLETFNRILQYLENDPEATPLEHITVMLELGDWHLLFDYSDAATSIYREAFAQALASGLSAEEIQALFDPSLPLQLPLFTSKPNSREKFGIEPSVSLDYDGYIDVNFSINRIGTANHIDVTGSSAGTTLALEERLELYLKNSPFRPAVSAGDTIRKEMLQVRFYYVFLQ